MTDIDLKDRKILYQLDLNCRQSNTQIGKKVGLSKEVVKYRIKRMEEEGIITGYWTEINTFKLGYNCYKLYLSFQDASPEKKDEIIKYFADCKNAWAVISSKGPVDLDVMLWVKDSHEFDLFWNKTLNKYGKYFSKQSVVILTGGIAYKKSFLLLDEYDKNNMVYFILKSGGKTADMDTVDYQILNELAVNARIPLIKLAEKLSCSSQTISHRIKNLIKQDIILALRISIDINRFGYLHPGVDIYLKDHTKKKQIMNFIEKNPFIEYIVEDVGWSDIAFELVVKNFEHLNQIIEEIDTQFPEAIRKLDFWMSRKYHRLRMLPEMEFK